MKTCRTDAQRNGRQEIAQEADAQKNRRKANQNPEHKDKPLDPWEID